MDGFAANKFVAYSIHLSDTAYASQVRLVTIVPFMRDSGFSSASRPAWNDCKASRAVRRNPDLKKLKKKIYLGYLTLKIHLIRESDLVNLVNLVNLCPEVR